MPASGFSGFGPDLFAFLEGLKANNSKAWFDAHRDAYEQGVRDPLGDFVETLTIEFAKAKIPLRGDRKASLFRLNRDVRFSKDKSPYKVNAAAVLTASGAKHDPGMFYLHFEPGASFLAAGFYTPEPPELLKLRRAVVKDSKAFLATIAALKKKGLELEREHTLKRPPKDFADVTDPALLDYVKFTSFVVSRKLRDEEALSAKLLALTVNYAQAALPLLQFGGKALAK